MIRNSGVGSAPIKWRIVANGVGERWPALIVEHADDGNHCDENRAAIPIQDYENDRFICVCTFCRWWGCDPLRIDSPNTTIRSKARSAVET
jgi:hypothetical protein